ncbi:YacL family protein [Thalassotalea aquiviva]|uniref:UPF0231 family protein n=1 Tax=Thalassotalea aquiviva TaxID=3242415 RepID=UPI00352B9178
MEYEFRKDFIDGKPMALFSFEHQAFGPWLETEIGQDEARLEHILAQATRLQTSASLNDEKEFVGREYTLLLTTEDASIELSSAFDDADVPENLEEDAPDFEQSYFASCGLEDFIQVLSSWKEFIAR